MDSTGTPFPAGLHWTVGWLRFLWIIIQNIYSIPAYGFLTWILLGPMRYLQSHAYYFIENHLFNWLLYVVTSWSHGANYRIEEVWTGEPLDESLKNGRVLCMANHQSTSDVPLMMYSLARRAVHWRLLWIMDAAFKYTNFGVVSFTHGDYFIRKGDAPGRLSRHVKLHMSPSHGAKNFVVLFPEGGFRYKRQAGSDRFAASRGLTPLSHVCWPYLGAYKELASTVSFSYVVDLTIIYRDETDPPSILDITRSRSPEKVVFFYRVFKLKHSINELSEEFLFDLWKGKEQLISEYRATVHNLGGDNELLTREHYDSIVERAESSLRLRGVCRQSPTLSISSGASSEDSSDVGSDEKWESLSMTGEESSVGTESGILCNGGGDCGKGHRRCDSNQSTDQIRKRGSNVNLASMKSEQMQMETSLLSGGLLGNHFLPLHQVTLVDYNWLKLILIHAFFLSIFYCLVFICSTPSSIIQLLVQVK